MNLVLILERNREVARRIDDSLRRQGKRGYFVTRRNRMIEVLRDKIEMFSGVMIVDEKDNLEEKQLRDYLTSIRWVGYKGEVELASDCEGALRDAGKLGYKTRYKCELLQPAA